MAATLYDVLREAVRTGKFDAWDALTVVRAVEYCRDTPPTPEMLERFGTEFVPALEWVAPRA